MRIGSLALACAILAAPLFALQGAEAATSLEELLE